MKFKVWCIYFDGKIVGYFPSYSDALCYLQECLVQPYEYVTVKKSEIQLVEEE